MKLPLWGCWCLLGWAVGLASCDDEPAGGADAAPDVVEETSEEPDSDTPPEPPLRELTSVSMLGDTPLDNLVVDPNFTPPVSGLDVITDGWMFRDLAGRAPRVRVLHLPDSPTRQPVLHLPGAPVNSQPAGALGELRGQDTPLEVSIWVGRDETDLAESPEVVADLAGFDPGLGRDVQWSLEREGEVRTIDGIGWQRYAVAIQRGPIGYAVLVVGDLSGTDLYLTGPVVVAPTTGTTGIWAAHVRPAEPVDAYVNRMVQLRRESRRR